MTDVVSRFDIAVEQIDGFEFRVRFDKPGYAELRMDEPAPLGRDAAPNAARVLAAAIGNCLAASLVFCTRKGGKQLSGVRAEVSVEVARNERKRLRIGAVRVVLHAEGGDPEALAACVPAFEDFCIVTQSVRAGIDVQVEVRGPGSSTP